MIRTIIFLSAFYFLFILSFVDAFIESKTWIKDLQTCFSLQNSTQVKKRDHHSDSGYIMCAGDHHIHDFIRTLYMIRITWQSSIPITLMHCSELTPDTIEIIEALNTDGNLHIVDICIDPEKTLGMTRADAYVRLRKYFCKVAAVILSPYEYSMLLDLDVVFFKDPERFFALRSFHETGLLFFRDRYLTFQAYSNDNNPVDDLTPKGIYQDLLKNFEFANVSITKSYVHEQFPKNGISLFWKTLKPYWDDNYPYGISMFQDSSIVMIDKSKHPKFIQILKFLLPIFQASNGDQDIYWTAATIANESFTFSPYIAGQYGDCSGFLIHFDPDDIYSNHPDQPDVLYMNAEYLVEDSSKRVGIGHFLQDVMIKPIRITTTMKPLPHNDCFSHHFRVKNCTCGAYECTTVPKEVQKHLLFQQWFMYSLMLKKNVLLPSPSVDFLDGKQCLRLWNDYLPVINEIINEKIIFHEEDCLVLGCPEYPITLTTESTEYYNPWKPSIGIICDPILFNLPSKLSSWELQERNRFAKKYRSPIIPINTQREWKDQDLLQCLGRRSIYLFQEEDRLLHRFPNFQTFASMGFDLDNVIRINFHDCELLEIGEDVPDSSTQLVFHSRNKRGIKSKS